MRRVSWVSLGCLAFFSSAHAASFDCAKAASKVEKLICTDSALSQLDNDLSIVYKQALKGGDDKQGVVGKERQWIRGTRDVCADTSCLTQAYIKRLREMSDAQVTSTAQDSQERPERILKGLDNITDYVFVHCVPAERLLILSPNYIDTNDRAFPDDPDSASQPDFVLGNDGDEGRCKWQDGTEIRVRFEQTDERRGDAGLSWSMWVDRSKWVENAVPLAASMNKGYIGMLTIDSAGMTVCTLQAADTGQEGSGQQDGADADKDLETCTMVGKAKMPQKPEQ